MEIDYGKLYFKIKENIERIHGIYDLERFSSANAIMISRRASLILRLDAAVITHRNKFKVIGSELPGRKALYHMLIMKFGWKPADIRSLPISDIIFCIQDELSLDRLPHQVREIISKTFPEEVAEKIDFQDIIDDEWDPVLYLSVQKKTDAPSSESLLSF